MNREAIFKRDGWKCRYCGLDASSMPLWRRRKVLTIDHMTPRSRGGTNDPWNLATACAPCNRKKANRTLLEFESGVPSALCSGPPLTPAEIKRVLAGEVVRREAPRAPTIPVERYSWVRRCGGCARVVRACVDDARFAAEVEQLRREAESEGGRFERVREEELRAEGLGCECAELRAAG